MIHESPDGGKTIKTREMNLPNHNSSNNCDTSQTSTEWLFDKLWDTPKDKFTWYAILEQAKEMEKQQIIDAFDEGQEYEYQYHINNTPKFDSQTYFTETYGSNGSDECQFEPTTNTSSATICKHCGREKFLHQ